MIMETEHYDDNAYFSLFYHFIVITLPLSCFAFFVFLFIQFQLQAAFLSSLFIRLRHICKYVPLYFLLSHTNIAMEKFNDNFSSLYFYIIVVMVFRFCI